MDDLLKDFDPAHRLSELNSCWSSLMAGAPAFSEKFQVSCSRLSFALGLVFALFSSFFSTSFSLCSKAYSWNHTSFFSSGQVEKKLVEDVKRLTAELSAKQAELDAERQGRSVSEEALHAHVGEAKRRKETTLAALKEASEKLEAFKKDREGIRVLSVSFLSFFGSSGFLIFIF